MPHYTTIATKGTYGHLSVVGAPMTSSMTVSGFRGAGPFRNTFAVEMFDQRMFITFIVILNNFACLLYALMFFYKCWF